MEKLYRTKDLGEAGALLNQNIKLARLDYDKDDFYWFVFENAKLAEAVAHTYWFGNLMQNVKKYFESLQTLKNMVFLQKKS
jgi:hypothetical protein